MARTFDPGVGRDDKGYQSNHPSNRSSIGNSLHGGPTYKAPTTVTTPDNKPTPKIKPKIKKTSAGDADTYWNKFKNKTKSYVNKHNAWSTNKYNQHIIKQNKKALINRLNSYLKLEGGLAVIGKEPFTINSSDDDIIKAINKLESKKNLGQLPYSEYPSKTGSAALDFFGKTFGAKDLSFDQAANYYMKTNGS